MEAIKFKTRINSGNIDIQFDQAIVKLCLTPEQARSFAKVLVVKADIAEEKKA